MLIGRPTDNPTINDNNASFDLLVVEKTMNKTTQEWETDIQSFRCISVCKPVTDRISNYVRKGLQLAIDGKLKRVDNDVVIVIGELFLIDRP